MNKSFFDIYRAKEKALRGERLDSDLMLRLLNIEENSPEFFELGKVAREVSAAITHNRAYLYGAIGIDYNPCKLSCDFCSMGEKWGIVSGENTHIMGTEEIVERARAFAELGIRWIVLRTNQEYDPGRLIHLVKEIKKQVPGNYELGLNIGEFDYFSANAFYESGTDFIYHSLRLREGVNTTFDPAQRLSTLSAVKNSKLDLFYLIEPIGVEHTNKEIVDNYDVILNYNTILAGGIARVPVENTPLGIHPQISDERLAHIIAFTRLASAGIVEDICVHPINELAISFGANVAVIDSGAIPRDDSFSQNCWRGINYDDMKIKFKNEGYDIYASKF